MVYRLVLVHRINGQMMEKYYLIGSVSAALALTVPAYAKGVYGSVNFRQPNLIFAQRSVLRDSCSWDPLNEACWYNIGDTKERLRWQVSIIRAAQLPPILTYR